MIIFAKIVLFLLTLLLLVVVVVVKKESSDDAFQSRFVSFGLKHLRYFFYTLDKYNP